MGVEQINKNAMAFFPRYCINIFSGDFSVLSTSKPVKLLRFLRDSHFFSVSTTLGFVGCGLP